MRQPLRSQEGHHGQTRFPIEHQPPPVNDSGSGSHGDRRLAGCEACAAAPDLFQSPPLTLEVEPANFCAETARRLLEIARRNEIRREAKLPLLPIAEELRRIKRREDLEEFERFEAAYGKAVWEEVLKARRDAEGPNWRPTWMEGIS